MMLSVLKIMYNKKSELLY